MHINARLALALALFFAACNDDDDTSDATVPDVTTQDSSPDTNTDTTPPDCGGCPTGKTCCPSRFTGDIPRCVDPTLNPENCGTCGTFCAGACRDSACIDAPECQADGTCADATLQCSGQGGLGRCCPAGTTFIASPADFLGCCPDGDICGCREGMCPISLAAAKHDIHYLDAERVAALGRELLATRLATWRYKHDPSARLHLGFIIDDGVPAPGIADDGAHVDLYGYVSLAVAALQKQQRDLDRIERELDELRQRVHALGR